MRQIKLFIACSLDGYIARKDGGIDWLFTDADYGYAEFYKSVDTTLMGFKTYEQALTFGEFPYKDKTNFVMTRRPGRPPQEHVKFISGDIIGFTKRLKDGEGGSIWLIGGSEAVSVLQRANLIDEYIVSVHPVILGSGIPLFKEDLAQTDLKLFKARTFHSGLVQLHYVKSPDIPSKEK